MDLANLTALFLSAKGRISRKAFWIGAGLLALWTFVAFVVLWSIVGPSLIQNFFGRLAGFPFVLLTIYFGYNLVAKRFNDRDRPAICAQAVAGIAALKSALDLVRITGDLHRQNLLDQLFVLIGTSIALWCFIELGMMRGTVGPNAHGEDPEAEL